jgi:hypothetical protein
MIGVCSHHNDYRLVWSINNELNLSLAKSDEDFVVVNKKGVNVSRHPFYEFEEEDTMVQFFLIKNKRDSKFLVPEKVEFDYFIFICEDNFDDHSDFLEQIRQVGSVLTAVEFNPMEISSTENLVFG